MMLSVFERKKTHISVGFFKDHLEHQTERLLASTCCRVPGVAAVPPWVNRWRCSAVLLTPTTSIKLKRVFVEIHDRALEAPGASLSLY